MIPLHQGYHIVLTKSNDMDQNLKNFKVCAGNIKKFIEKLSASRLQENCSYLIFLNADGRYFADCFFIESLSCFVAPEDILKRLWEYFKSMDLRDELSFEWGEFFVFFSDQQLFQAFSDPRLSENFICFSSHFMDINLEYYFILRLKFKLAEFHDFILNKSLIHNYGAVAKFISSDKGCYPGQEVVARFLANGAKKTVDSVSFLDDFVIEILLNFNGLYLVYKHLN